MKKFIILSAITLISFAYMLIHAIDVPPKATIIIEITSEFESESDDVTPINISFNKISKPFVVKLKNVSDKHHSGEYSDFSIEYYDSEEWVNIPKREYILDKNGKKIGIINLGVTIELAPGESEIISQIPLSWFDFDFVSGKYRAVFRDKWYKEFTIS